jgi:hypothetical protein
MSSQSSPDSIQILSNIQVFYEIARDSFADAERLLAAHRTPRGDGGYVLTPDPKRGSFKNSLVSISFAGAYIDLHIRMAYIVRHNDAPPKKWDRMTYEAKLADLGVTDQVLLKNCEEFREIRNSVLHEKPLIIGRASDSLPGTAQDGAVRGMAVVDAIRTAVPLTTASS